MIDAHGSAWGRAYEDVGEAMTEGNDARRHAEKMLQAIRDPKGSPETD